jgi:hypothetical protein
MIMATAKNSAKSSPGKRTVQTAEPGKAKPVTKPKPPVKAAPKVKAKPAVKTASPRVSKPKTVAAEQRRNYIEVAAYHIAERRGFAAGDPLEDWVQAEAEIDRLLAKGLLGG